MSAPATAPNATSAPTPTPAPTVEAIRAALQHVMDPEIPMVSVVDLGIIQAIEVASAGGGDSDSAVAGDGERVDTVGAAVRIDITPTFTGCPALEMMRAEIGAAVLALGAASVDVRIVLDPPWTSDRIAPAAREAMRQIGLAPPPPAARFRSDPSLSLTVDVRVTADAVTAEKVACPFCGSPDTVTDNPFGSTLCRSVHYCNACRQPFEAFKAL